MPVHPQIWLCQSAGCAPLAQQRGEPRSGMGGDSSHVSKATCPAATVARTWPLIESGDIRPIVDSTFPLAEVDAAHARLNSGDAIGKILLTLD